jgi:hypothetical protein
MDINVLGQTMWTIDAESECWLWRGSLTPKGYGQVTIGAKENNTVVHRVMWTLLFGKIPYKHDVHHTCPNKHCANPVHLRISSHAEHSKSHAAMVVAPRVTKQRREQAIRWATERRREEERRRGKGWWKVLPDCEKRQLMRSWIQEALLRRLPDEDKEKK